MTKQTVRIFEKNLRELPLHRRREITYGLGKTILEIQPDPSVVIGLEVPGFSRIGMPDVRPTAATDAITLESKEAERLHEFFRMRVLAREPQITDSASFVDFVKLRQKDMTPSIKECGHHRVCHITNGRLKPGVAYEVENGRRIITHHMLATDRGRTISNFVLAPLIVMPPQAAVDIYGGPYGTLHQINTSQ